MNQAPYRKLLFNILSAIGILSVLLIVINAATYMSYSFRKVGYNDDFRFAMLHVKPWLDGTWNLNSLWGDVHPNPIHGVILYLSTAVESMKFELLPYLIFPFLILKWFLFTLGHRFVANLTLSQTIFSGLCFALVLFSLNSIDQYTWNSVGIIQIYHALGAGYLLAFLNFVKQQNKVSTTFLIVLSLIFLLTARQFAIPWFAASVVVLFLRKITNAETGDKRSLYTFLAIVISALLVEKTFHIVIQLEFGYSVDSGIINKFLGDWGHRPLELLKYLMVSLTSSLINTYHLKSIGVSDNLILAICIVFSAVYFSAIVLSIKKIKSLVHVLSLVMLLFPLVTIPAELMYRVSIETEWLMGYVPRYVSFRDIGVLGIIVVMLDTAYRSNAKRISFALTSALLLFITTLHINYAVYRWELLPYVVKYHERLADAVRFVGYHLHTHPIDCSDETRNRYLQPKHPERYNLKNPEFIESISNMVNAEYLKSTNTRLVVPTHYTALCAIQFWNAHNLNVFADNRVTDDRPSFTE